MIGALIGLPIVVGVLGLIVLVAGRVQVPDKPVNDGERPGGDDQWVGFRATVPNIRKKVLAEQVAEQSVELAFRPASLDTPADSFCWLPDRSKQP